MSEAIYTHRPRVVRALQWTGDNFDKVSAFVGDVRCAAENLGTKRLYVFTVDGVARALHNDWFYFDERRELHVMSEARFAEEFSKGGAWPLYEVMPHPV